MILVPRRSLEGGSAFTIVELLIVVVLIGVLSGVSISIISNDLQRSRINTIAQGFASWLELIRKSSQRTESGCRVTIASLSSGGSGAQIAEVVNQVSGEAPCAANSVFVFSPPSGGAQDRINTGATSDTLIFTPRGTIIGSSGQITSDWELRLSLTGMTGLRCVRLSGLLGALQIGSNNAASAVSSSCTSYLAY